MVLRYVVIGVLALVLLGGLGVKTEGAYRHRVRGWTFESRTVRIRFDSFSGEKTIDTANPECYQHLMLDAPLHGNCY